MKIYKISTCIKLIFLSFILFIANSLPLLAKDPLLKEAAKYDKYSKPNFNREKAVNLYKQYAEKKTTDDYKKIQVYHRIAQLYSYAAGPGNKDSAKAIEYYNHLLQIAGDRIVEDVMYARSNLTSIGKKNHEERLIANIQFYTWIIQALLDPGLEQKIFFPSDIKESEKIS